MYYVEEIINDRLCFKTTPKGEWQEIPPEELTARIIGLKDQITRLLAQIKN